MNLLALAVELVAVALKYDGIKPGAVFSVTFDFETIGGQRAVSWRVQVNGMSMWWDTYQSARERLLPEAVA